jgi:uncharacterized protein YbjT (DUF2867 family)
MRICVIGGTGNISTSLVTLLLKQGHDVTYFNRGRSGDAPEGAGWIQGDRRDRATFERTMQGQRSKRLTSQRTSQDILWDA